jgi:hypothetical protein
MRFKASSGLIALVVALASSQSGASLAAMRDAGIPQERVRKVQSQLPELSGWMVPARTRSEAGEEFLRFWASAVVAEAGCGGKTDMDAMIHAGHKRGLNLTDLEVISDRLEKEAGKVGFFWTIATREWKESFCAELKEIHNGSETPRPTVVWK